MSDTRRQDPLRRTPPTIDLKAEVVPSKDGKPAGTPAGGAAAAGPAAAKGAGSEPAPKADIKSASPGETKPAATPPGATASQPPKGSEPVKQPETSKPAVGAAATASTPVAKGGDAPKPADKPAADAKPTSDAKPASDTKPASDAKPVADTKPATDSKPAEPAKPATTARVEPAKSELPKSEPAKVEPAKPEPAKPSPQAAASASAVRQPSPAAPTERYGTASVATAGFVGGVIGAALAAAFTFYAFQDGGADQRIAALERRIATLPAGTAGPAESRIAAIETGLKQTTDEARSAAKQAAEALARPLGSGADQEARTSLQTLTTRVQDGATKTAASLTDFGQKLDAQGRGLTVQTERLEALGKTTADQIALKGKDLDTYGVHQRSLQADVALLRTGTAALDTRTTDADKRIVGLSDNVGRISADLANLSPATIKAGLRMVISGRLDDALRNGAPLGPALSALDKLGTDAQALAPLRPFTDLPAPSAAALLAEFKPLGLAMTTVPPPPGETWWDKGRRLLGKAVTVQTVGDGSGQDVPGLVARIESSLSRGAIGEAKAAWDRLPQDKRGITAGWGAKLTARAAADDGARRISAQSLAVLDSSTR